MACERRMRTGDCRHHHCGYPAESGVDCVDVIFGAGRGFCELGLGCVVRCGFAFGDVLVEDALGAWEGWQPSILEGVC